MIEIPEGKVFVELRDHPISKFLSDPKNSAIRNAIEADLNIAFETTWSGKMHFFANSKEHGEIVRTALDKLANEITIPYAKFLEITGASKSAITQAALEKKTTDVRLGIVTPDLSAIFGQFAGQTFETGGINPVLQVDSAVRKAAHDNGLKAAFLFPDTVLTADVQKDRIQVELEQVPAEDSATKRWKIKGFKQG